MAGEVGGWGHSDEEARTPFLPNGEEGVLQVEGKIEFRMEVVPAGEPGIWLIVKKCKNGDYADEEKQGPVSDEPTFDGVP